MQPSPHFPTLTVPTMATIAPIVWGMAAMEEVVMEAMEEESMEAMVVGCMEECTTAQAIKTE